MLLPRKTTWVIIGACFLTFFGVSNVKAYSTSFEGSEGYLIGFIRDQNGWTETGTAENGAIIYNTNPYSGFLSVKGRQETLYNLTLRHSFATSTTYKQCLYFDQGDGAYTENGFFSLRRTGSGISCGTIQIGTTFSVYSGSGYFNTGYTVNTGGYNGICIEYDDITNNITYSYDNGTDAASSTMKNYSFTACDYLQLDPGKINGADKSIYYDTLTDEFTAPSPYSLEKLSWDFPQDGYEISNDEWTDWALLYDMDSADIGEVGNILIIVSQTSDGLTYDDWEFISTTTEPTAWTINRGDTYPDGDVYSKAKLVKVDDPGGCDTGMEQDCAWTTVAETEVIHWISSSTGYTIFDNPYDRPAGFYPASTTAEEEEEGGFWNALFGRLTNVFPLSLAKQIYSAFRTATQDQGVTPVLITLKDLTGPAADDILGGTDPVMLSAQLLEDNSELWTDYIFPFFEACVYLIGFFLTLFILFPKFRSLDFGGHQKASPSDVSHIQPVNLRKPAGALTIDLRKNKY